MSTFFAPLRIAITEPLGTVSLTITSPPGPSTMKRGRSKPEANSSTENPAGTLILAPAGRGTIVGAPELGGAGACASASAEKEIRTRKDFMNMGSILHAGANYNTSNTLFAHDTRPHRHPRTPRMAEAALRRAGARGRLVRCLRP